MGGVGISDRPEVLGIAPSMLLTCVRERMCVDVWAVRQIARVEWQVCACDVCTWRRESMCVQILWCHAWAAVCAFVP